LLGRIGWSQIWERRAFWLIGVTPALILSLLALLGSTPSIDRTLGTLAGNMQRILALLILGGLLYGIWRWGESVGWRTTFRLLGIGVVALLLLLTVRFSYMLTYINYDMATEYLVYAHASPDVKRALREIDSISERTVGGRNIVVAYDNESSWPLSWYMRLYPNHKFYGAAPNSDNMSAPIIIVGPENYDKVHPYVMRDYVKRTYRLVWWPDMDYFNMTWDRFFNAFLDPQQRERVLQIAFYRRYRDTADYSRYRDLAQWPHRHEFEMWVRRDLATQIWDLGVAPTVQVGNTVNDLALDKEVEVAALASYNGVYDGLPLLNPRAVAVGADGTRAIADSDNHRIVILNSNGDFVRSFGAFCNLAEGEAGGCTDPDGSGPLALGDGQFNQPWGVAIDAAGHVYVADTWNGRIQVFDNAGLFLEKWGTFNTTNGELGDAYALFGPRGVAIDNEGNLLVADTGNKRIIKYTATGELLQQVGGGGVVSGRFEEPVGVSVSPVDGSVYVADTWNQRIQKFSPALEFMAEWPAAGWDSQEINDKPYLAVAPNGDLYATDPQFSRVVVYAPTGEVKAAFGTFGNGATNFNLPTGIAVDPTTGVVVVTDASNNRVQSFPPVQ
jgi:sugar lactone lactonase YvrE